MCFCLDIKFKLSLLKKKFIGDIGKIEIVNIDNFNDEIMINTT